MGTKVRTTSGSQFNLCCSAVYGISKSIHAHDRWLVRILIFGESDSFQDIEFEYDFGNNNPTGCEILFLGYDVCEFSVFIENQNWGLNVLVVNGAYLSRFSFVTHDK